MSADYGIALTGIRNAALDLNRAARRIAHAGLHAESVAPGAGASDPATDLIAAKRAVLAGKANLKALSLQDEVAEATLDLLA